MIDKTINIGNKKIGSNEPVFIAAEIGINHNGDMALAKQMIDAAKDSGADAVKFQNYETGDFIFDKSLTYKYINGGEEIVESQWDMFKRCELSDDNVIELKNYCDELDIIFFSTPTSEKGVGLLEKLNISLMKNGSDFLTNLDLIRSFAKSETPLVLSTGMASISDIDDAVSEFEKYGGKDLILLLCTSCYPTPPEDVNLNKIKTLMDKYECPVGFSDHTKGVLASAGATAKGACFIEKHFTLDKGLQGPDHQFSSDPAELKELVKTIRSVETMLGNDELIPTSKENLSREQFRLSCAVNKELKPGDKISRDDIIFRRPGTGFPPKKADELAGSKVIKLLKTGDIINKDSIS